MSQNDLATNPLFLDMMESTLSTRFAEMDTLNADNPILKMSAEGASKASAADQKAVEQRDKAAKLSSAKSQNMAEAERQKAEALSKRGITHKFPRLFTQYN